MRSLLESEAPALHRHEPPAADHEVVKNLHIDQLSCLDHGTCDRHIRTRSGITAWVVVRYDDRRPFARIAGRRSSPTLTIV